MNAPTRNGPVRMTSREFNQHTGRAKAAAAHGPVIITDRGEPTHVLMSHAEYEKLSSKQKPKKPMSLLEALEQKGGPEYDFDLMDYIPPRRHEPPRFTFDDEE
ncbi:MAG TPA: type II toxin-antitoxin system Phd/YefM family antitoxin [Devosia sp.]